MSKEDKNEFSGTKEELSKKGIFIGALWERRKKIMNMLMENFGRCYYCNINVIRYTCEKGKDVPHNGATLDHIRSRYFRKKHEVVPKVLCCYACNQKRSLEETKDLIQKHGWDVIHNRDLRNNL